METQHKLNEEEAFYANRRPSRGRGSGRYRGNGHERENREYRKENNDKPLRRQNPLDNNGEVSRCSICGSIFLWAKRCPESLELLRRRRQIETKDRVKNVTGP